MEPVMHPDVGLNHFHRGCMLRDQGRYELAAKEFHAAATLDPSDAFAPSLLSMCLVCLDRYSEAYVAAQEAIRRGPDQALPFVALGYALWGRGYLKEAHAAANQAVEFDPSFDEGFILLAQLAEAQGRWPAMLANAEQALALDPMDARAILLRAKALISLDRVNDALDCLKPALRRNPENATIHMTLGMALLHAGQETQAFDHFKEALRLDPNSNETRQSLVEAMKSRNRLYRAGLRAALWFTRKQKHSPLWLKVAISAYAIVMLVWSCFWFPAMLFLFVPFVLLIAMLLLRKLSFAVFDLMLLWDPHGRILLDTRRKVAAWTVGGFLALAAVAIVAAVFAPMLLLFAIPTATFAPWIIHAQIAAPAGHSPISLRIYFIVAVLMGEAGLAISCSSGIFHVPVHIVDRTVQLVQVSVVLVICGSWIYLSERNNHVA